jgi:hypothetical protein
LAGTRSKKKLADRFINECPSTVPLRRGSWSARSRDEACPCILPMLIKTNYQEWCMVMKVQMEADGFLDVFNDLSGTNNDDYSS